jgi:translocation and assembly module TamA
LELQVLVTGLEGVEEQNVLTFLDIYQERDSERLEEHRLEHLHRVAPEQIREALQPFGYYKVEVDAQLRRPERGERAWRATYRVSPGPAVKIAVVDYRLTGPGADDPALPRDFGMQPGDVLLHVEYEKAKQAVVDAISREGYLDARMERHRVIVDLETYSARVQLHFSTGPQYYLGAVSFKQDLLDEDFLQRFVTFEPGTIYDPARLLGLQSSLLGAEYYDEVEIVPLKEAAQNNVVPLEVVAHPNKPNKYRAGLGFVSDSGPRVTLDWTRRYIGRRGHKIKAELSWSQTLQKLKGEYRIPLEKPTQDYFAIKPEWRGYDTASRQGDLYKIGVLHSMARSNGWRRTTGIDYRLEDFSAADETNEQVKELVPHITWDKTVADDPIYTSRGYRLEYQLLGAVEGLISPASYLSGSARVKWIRSFWEDYRLLTRADLGVTLANSVFDLPASRRFYTGGDNSIRGWALDVLGPNDPDTNEAVGGRYLAVGSLELERKVYKDWSGAVWTDFGNAFDPDFDKQVEVGAGFGVRWKSPVGQVRFDVAFAMTKPGNPIRLVLVVGPDL